MKYKDPQTGEFKDITVKASDTLPIGTIVDYDGDIVPDGWETVDDTGTYKKIKKIATSIGVLGKILNSKSSSKQDTYSCDYINKLNTYSEEEQVIGTWTDGKPLYRKVITKNITSTSQAVSDVFKNLNTIVSINGIFTGADYIIPYGFNNDKTFVAVFYEKSSNTLQFRSNYSSGKTRTILEYTKITD